MKVIWVRTGSSAVQILSVSVEAGGGPNVRWQTHACDAGLFDVVFSRSLSFSDSHEFTLIGVLPAVLYIYNAAANSRFAE